MKFCWCKIDVIRMDESRDFYENLVGLKVTKELKPSPDVDIVFLGEGETMVELIQNKEQIAANNLEGISLGFQVKDIDEIKKKVMEKGIELESEIIKPNPKTKFFYVRDPNGVQIQFVELED